MNASRLLPTVSLVAAMLSCSPVTRRDLSSIPQRQITFDDMCHLQDYFDQRNATQARPFRALDETSTQTQRTEPDEHGRMHQVMVGEGTYAVNDLRARQRLQQLLADDFTRLPPLRFGRDDGPVRVRVSWWASGEMRRLRPDASIEVVGGHETVSLPFDPCVGEFLFGGPVYALRRHVLDSDRARANGQVPAGTDEPILAEPVTDAATPVDATDVTADGG